MGRVWCQPTRPATHSRAPPFPRKSTQSHSQFNAHQRTWVKEPGGLAPHPAYFQHFGDLHIQRSQPLYLGIWGAAENHSFQGVPDFLKLKRLEVFYVCCGKFGDPVMTQGKSQTGVNELPESGSCFRSPFPQKGGYLCIVVDTTPQGIGFHRLAVVCRFTGRVGVHKYGSVSQLHVELNQDQFTDYELIRYRLYS